MGWGTGTEEYPEVPLDATNQLGQDLGQEGRVRILLSLALCCLAVLCRGAESQLWVRGSGNLSGDIFCN